MYWGGRTMCREQCQICLELKAKTTTCPNAISDCYWKHCPKWPIQSSKPIVGPVVGYMSSVSAASLPSMLFLMQYNRLYVPGKLSYLITLSISEECFGAQTLWAPLWSKPQWFLTGGWASPELLTPQTITDFLANFWHEVTQTIPLNHHLFSEVLYLAADQKCIAPQHKDLKRSQQQTIYWLSSYPAPVLTSWAAPLAKLCPQMQHWSHFILRKLTQERDKNVRKGERKKWTGGSQSLQVIMDKGQSQTRSSSTVSNIFSP